MEKELEEKNFGWIRSDSEQAAQYEIKVFDQKVYLINQVGEAVEVTPKGSLGIMALGHTGHLAWLKARQLKNSDG